MKRTLVLALVLFGAALLPAQQSIYDWDDVTFDLGSARLLGGLPRLMRLAAVLVANRDHRARLTGHPDAGQVRTTGDKLARLRAASVRDYLLRNGVEAAQIEIALPMRNEPGPVPRTRCVAIAVTDSRGQPVWASGPLLPDGGTLNALAQQMAQQMEALDMILMRLDKLDELILMQRDNLAAWSKLEDELNQLRDYTAVGAAVSAVRQESSTPAYLPPLRPVEFAGRAFLAGGLPETPGYGLYSYILLPQKPSESDTRLRNRYLAAVGEYLAVIPASEFTEKPLNVPRRDINITYLPVREDRSFSSASDVLDNYHWSRAQVIMATLKSPLGKAADAPGPFFVCSTHPLGQGASPRGRYLIFDASSAPEAVVRLYLKAFLKQTSQPRFWERKRAEKWLLETFTFIESGGEVFDEIEQGLTKSAFLTTILNWFPKPK